MYDEKMWVVHYTCRENFEKIKKKGYIKSAWHLMTKKEREYHAKNKRDESVPLKSGVILRDQKPLTDRIQFCDSTQFDKYVKYLNEHVFFWPTRYAGNERRRNFRGRYPGECAICCQLCDLEKENKALFSRYNSGATPRQPGKYKRSRNMFKPIKCRKKEPIVEVVFKRSVKLPSNVKY